jgi:uncharacterized protein (DUF2267 family)/ferritin-like metal-binding protein YciE
MTATGLEVFDKTLQTTNVWLKEIGELIGPDRQRCYHALRAVLFALRDRLMPDEAAHLAAQMPLLIKGVFYDGYKPAGKPHKIRSRQEFLHKINEHLTQIGPIGAEDAARAVFRVLDRHITRGELEEVKLSLPQDIRTLFPAQPEPRTRIKTFEDMYICELQELVSVEEQLGQALSGIVHAVSNASLRTTLARHQQGTAAQKGRLMVILKKHGANLNTHTDQALLALLRETDKMRTILKGGALRDAGLLASIQRLKHYEIAAYGTAAALAGQLGLRDEQRMLHQSLEEEKEMDLQLTQLAKAGVNQNALPA